MESQHSYLILEEENGETRTVTLVSSSETFLGRSQECRVILSDDRASRKHAVIHFQKDRWFLTDLKSRNGTLVNDRLIEQPTPLNHGDFIKIGHSQLTFFLETPENSETTGEEPLDSPSGTGVFGISELSGAAPSDSLFNPDEIVDRRKQTSFLQSPGQTVTAKVTRTGYDAADLCQLAYQLGKAEHLSDTAKLALEGLLNATDGDAAGLWLLPQEVKSTFRISQLRLVAHIAPDNMTYSHISESLAKTVISSREAVLVDERKMQETVRYSKTPPEETTLHPFHTLAAPIRFEDSVLGLIHIYNGTNHRLFTPDDLEYTLAVADTLGTALSHLTREKELSADLKDARQENILLRELLTRETEIIGVSPPMCHVAQLAKKASEGKATLLIYGESGVGKELIARAAHFAGPRKDKPFVCLNCAAISESLLASELFGHEKGAFTGATERKIGKFEAANKGTLFLDEIGEMSPALQAKFLRVLEGAPFERVGGNTPITVDVRVVAATNRNLEQEVAEGRFRHDLFFRLRVLEIMVPPLRKRKEDIPVLANHFLERFSKETGRKIHGFSPAAMKRMLEHRWPGNVRELKNTIERAVLLGTSRQIEEDDFVLSVLRTTGNTVTNKVVTETEPFTPMSIEEMENRLIFATLEYCEGNKSSAAKILGIERTTLDRKIKRYKLNS
ncbi:MAG: sigma 54-interacting transcriptional regulator [Planctomycetaceae bacterium]|jgi:Nif-specific regulatory protein|nr:sigma 54-interacting transcriptional regulator [Planctomycetaceae bacterium]